jgi:hypothetical protein
MDQTIDPAAGESGRVADDAGRVVDEVIDAYRSNRVRLWLANFSDLTEDFGDWGGTIRVSAERYLRAWEPNRDALLERLRRQESVPTVDAAVEQLLPLAREGFVRDLESKKVPHRVADRAKTVLLPRPPVQQWKM